MTKVIFILKDGVERTIDARDGLSVLQIAEEHALDLEGACRGCLACATCHVIVDKESYGKLPEASPDEQDLLEFAFGVTPTSRLGCQVKISKELEGMTIQIPSAGRG